MNSLLFRAVVAAAVRLAAVSCDDGLSAAATPSCNIQPCWNQYQEAQEMYQSEVPGVSDHALRQCITLRTYRNCLRELHRRFASICIADISYQGSRRIIEYRMTTYNCSDVGPVYPEQGPLLRSAQPAATSRPPCAFRGSPTHRMCSLFGDPHLITFGSEIQTCKLLGAWPLVENSFLTVQVSNEAFSEGGSLAAGGSLATITSQVTIIVHPMRGENICSPEEAVFYHAEGGNLSLTFDDGLVEHGRHGSLTLRGTEDRVDIHLRYIDTTVIVQRVSQYLSVSVVMPEDVVNATGSGSGPARRGGAGGGGVTSGSAPRQLCIEGCPRRERIDLAAYLGRSRARSGGSGGLAAQQEQSKRAEQCKAAAALLSGHFLDVCVFDLISTGDGNFTTAAALTFELWKRYGGALHTAGQTVTRSLSEEGGFSPQRIVANCGWRLCVTLPPVAFVCWLASFWRWQS